MYEEKIQAAIRQGRLLPGEGVLFDLDQNPAAGRGRMVLMSVASKRVFLPKLIQLQMLWNTSANAPLSSIDHLKAHGWPVEEEDKYIFGCCTCWKTSIAQGKLSHKEIVRMMGDSWHIHFQVKWLMWLLSVLGRRECRLPPSPKCWKSLASSSQRACIQLFDDDDAQDGASETIALDGISEANTQDTVPDASPELVRDSDSEETLVDA